MKTKLSYRHKTIALLIVLLLGSIVAFSIAIKPTIVAKRNLSQLRLELEGLDKAPERRAMLIKKMSQYDRLIGAKATNQKFEQQQVLDYISNYCDNTKATVREFPEVHSFTKDNFILNTITFSIEGNFKLLLQLLYSIETDLKIGSVFSVEFYTEDEVRTKKKRLFLRVYLHTINQIKS